MRPNLDKKIAAYKEEKAKKSFLEDLITEKRRNLEKMMEAA